MRDVSIFVDAEKAAIDYLLPLLGDFDSTVRISNSGAGARFVRVRRVGGTELTPNHDRPRLDVMVWHDTDRTRMQLAMRLWAWLRAADGDINGGASVVYVSTVLGPRQMPDPADPTKSVCLFTVELAVRAA